MSAFSLLKQSGGRIFNLLPILTRKDQQTVKSRKSCSPAPTPPMIWRRSTSSRRLGHGHSVRPVGLYTQGLESGSYDAKVRRDLLRQRAFAYEDLEQYERAENDYDAALKIEPLDPSFYSKRGFYFFRRGRYDDALVDFRKGSALVPTDGGFPFGEGEVQQKLRQYGRPSSATLKQSERMARSRATTANAAMPTTLWTLSRKPKLTTTRLWPSATIQRRHRAKLPMLISVVGSRHTVSASIGRRSRITTPC